MRCQGQLIPSERVLTFPAAVPRGLLKFKMATSSSEDEDLEKFAAITDIVDSGNTYLVL